MDKSSADKLKEIKDHLDKATELIKSIDLSNEWSNKVNSMTLNDLNKEENKYKYKNEKSFT